MQQNNFQYRFDIEQGSDEWRELRRTRFTASMISALFAAQSTATYQNAINDLVYKRFSGKDPESYSNEWMERGTELEPEARRSFELSTFQKVKQVGFVEYSEWLGCSPDGLINDDGLLQIKCPKYSTLLSYHYGANLGRDYEMQLHGEIWLTDRQYNIFYAWHPDLPPFVKRYDRAEKIIKEIEGKVEIAIDLVKARLIVLSEKTGDRKSCLI